MIPVISLVCSFTGVLYHKNHFQLGNTWCYLSLRVHTPRVPHCTVYCILLQTLEFNRCIIHSHWLRSINKRICIIYYIRENILVIWPILFKLFLFQSCLWLGSPLPARRGRRPSGFSWHNRSGGEWNTQLFLLSAE